ncbi:DNA polymerase ligase-domain-containing protein [Aspergillus spectabilis]
MHDAEDEVELGTANRRISTLAKPISPPPIRPSPIPVSVSTPARTPSLSALEAGTESLPAGDHLDRISTHLAKSISPDSLLPIDTWKSLYTSNCHSKGHHFVIHQHDHPIAGPHYDLRLQFSESSSLSWSIMYGLPGDPNSRRLSRNATETRVHCFWNHLIETASDKTGSMIIWDTGVYEVLPDKPRGQNDGPETDTESDLESGIPRPPTPAPGVRDGLPENEKLRKAFQNHKIHLRLHGTRLPKGYTVFLRRDKSDIRSPATPASLASMPKKRKRRRKQDPVRGPSTTSESESESDSKVNAGSSKRAGTGSPAWAALGKRKTRNGDDENDKDNAEHSDAAEGNDAIDYLTRLNNAYPGSTNDIGSIHQRRWFLMLDRVGCGFIPTPESKSSSSSAGNPTGKKRWTRGVDKRSGTNPGFDPFFVRGPGVERSVVTGRLGGDVLCDEGVEGFVPRRGWNPVLM